MKLIAIEFNCKFCGAKSLIKYGTSKGVQYWYCKACRRKFADNDALPGMKTPIMEVGAALSMYYRGMSIDEIRRHLDQQYTDCPSDSTVYDWVCRFTDEAVAKARKYKPKVGYVWVADETMLDIGGTKVWFWDLIDVKTRYLLASHLSYQRTAEHAKRFVEKGAEVAGKPPKVIITDKLFAYLDGIEMAFGADTQHVQSKGFSLRPNTNLIERFHGTLKSRTKVMRGLKSPESALLILDGWLVYYNFFRPHEALGDKTPAEKAGIDFPLKNWLEVVKQSKGAKSYTSLYPLGRVSLGLPTKYNIRKSQRKRRVAKKALAGASLSSAAVVRSR